MSETAKAPTTRKRKTRVEPRVTADIDHHLHIPAALVQWATAKGLKLSFIRSSTRNGAPDVTNLERKFSEGWQPLLTSEIPAEIELQTADNPFFDKDLIRAAGSTQIRRGEMVLAKIDLNLWKASKEVHERRALQTNTQYMEEARRKARETSDGLTTLTGDSEI